MVQLSCYTEEDPLVEESSLLIIETLKTNAEITCPQIGSRSRFLTVLAAIGLTALVVFAIIRPSLDQDDNNSQPSAQLHSVLAQLRHQIVAAPTCTYDKS